MDENSVVQKKMELCYLREQINLKKCYWTNNEGTNCLAFALGLDVPSKSICTGEYAYNGGILYKVFSTHPQDISHLTQEERFELDYSILGLYFEEIDFSDQLYDEEEWKIAYFIDPDEEKDFHFLRQTNDAWHHKPGRAEPPTLFDDHNRIIFNPTEAYFEYPNYVYKKCYRMSKKKFQ